LIKNKKSLGQNFLIDKNIANKIINQTNIENKQVIEIGPGLGFLTDQIIKKKPNKLILIEKDNKITAILKNKYKEIKNIEIYNEDAVKFDYKKFKKSILISNLPYNVSTQIIFNLLKFKNNFSELIIMIQKEVADKMNYRSKTKNNKYKFIIEALSEYKICFNVSNNVFYPKPKVQSSIVKITPYDNEYKISNLEIFANIIFNHKRKKIANIINLENNFKYLADKRVEDLKFNELIEIFNVS
jgi:16S rRNA (adenine1518-N6/adenine1519-N6)-dimethyltransferase